MPDHTLLPPELWLEIFEWATYNPTLLQGDTQTPFQPLPDATRDPNLQVRVTISSVCRIWRTWVAQSLFEDVKIRHGAHALQQVLERRGDSGRYYGEMVRRVVLPYRSTVPDPYWLPQSIEILKLCPRMHTLLRPQYSILDSLVFDREAGAVTFPSLERLEWWYFNDAERTGGINSLSDVLRNAPRLRYLFIGGATDYMCMDPRPIVLPNLETLRLNIRSGRLLRQILSRWSLPFLTHLVMDSPPVKDGLQAIWEVFGDKLEIMEFGKHVRFLMNDDISPCLKGCPNLKELNYHIFFAKPPDDIPSHSHLTTVGLHSAVNSLLAEGATLWNLIELHFDFLCAEHLDGLQRVLLYGDWRPILSHPRFHLIQKKLEHSGRVLQVADYEQYGNLRKYCAL